MFPYLFTFLPRTKDNKLKYHSCKFFSWKDFFLCFFFSWAGFWYIHSYLIFHFYIFMFLHKKYMIWIKFDKRYALRCSMIVEPFQSSIWISLLPFSVYQVFFTRIIDFLTFFCFTNRKTISLEAFLVHHNKIS